MGRIQIFNSFSAFCFLTTAKHRINFILMPWRYSGTIELRAFPYINNEKVGFDFLYICVSIYGINVITFSMAFNSIYCCCLTKEKYSP